MPAYNCVRETEPRRRVRVRAGMVLGKEEQG